MQRHPELKYVMTENGGIDIETKPGAVARAVFTGKVSAIFRQDGYNTVVMVRHGSYLTIYVNLSEIYVRTGETVKPNQNIGKIFSDREDERSDTDPTSPLYRNLEASNPIRLHRRKFLQLA